MVTPARAFAVELKSLYVAHKRGPELTPLQVLERIARAADQFAHHTEHGVPQLTLSEVERLREGTWE